MLNTSKPLKVFIFVIWAKNYSVLINIYLREKTLLGCFSLNFFHRATQPLNTPGAQNCQIASYTVRRTMTIQHNGKTQMIHFAEHCPVPSTKPPSTAHWNIQ